MPTDDTKYDLNLSSSVGSRGIISTGKPYGSSNRENSEIITRNAN